LLSDRVGGTQAAESWRKVCAKNQSRDMLRLMLKKALKAPGAGSDDEDEDETAVLQNQLAFPSANGYGGHGYGCVYGYTMAS
jgi:hypothetical protein